MAVSAVCYSCGGAFPPSTLFICPTCHEKVCTDPTCDCAGECRCSVMARCPQLAASAVLPKTVYLFSISYVKDLEGKYVAVNNPLEFLDMRAGYTDIEVFGEKLAMEAREYDRHVVETGNTTEYVMEMLTRSGKRLWQHIKFPIVTGDSVFVGGYCKDITDMLVGGSRIVC